MTTLITYHRWLELQLYEPTSIDRLMSIHKKVAIYLQENQLKISAASLKHFVDYCTQSGYSNAYLMQIHWGLQTYVAYLRNVKGEQIDLILPKPKTALQTRTALPDKAIKKIEAWLSRQQKDYWLRQMLWCLFYGAGLRRQEALNLEIKDVNISYKTLKVLGIKGGKTRLLPLSTRQVRAISEYLKSERPAAKEGFENRLILGRRGGSARSLLGAELEHWQVKTGLGKALTWHALRHTIATHLFEQGLRLEQVSRFLGHQNIASTEHYLHYLK